MTKTNKINANMYTILVTNQMDKFTVTEASNTLISSTEEFLELNDVRKSLYRQLYKFEQKGWLSSSGKGRAKRYSVTDDFKNLCVTSNKLGSPVDSSTPIRNNDFPTNEVAALHKDKKATAAELEITLCELTRYKNIGTRFPKLVKIVSPLTQKAHERSVELLGDLNALSNVLKSLSEAQK
ncbi:hypothetical protein ACQZVD_000793 [Vibrio parahaemolyticus]